MRKIILTTLLLAGCATSAVPESERGKYMSDSYVCKSYSWDEPKTKAIKAEQVKIRGLDCNPSKEVKKTAAEPTKAEHTYPAISSYTQKEIKSAELDAIEYCTEAVKRELTHPSSFKQGYKGLESTMRQDGSISVVMPFTAKNAFGTKLDKAAYCIIGGNRILSMDIFNR